MRAVLALVSLGLLAGCAPYSVLSGTATAGQLITDQRSGGQMLDDVTIAAKVRHYYLQTDVNDLFTNTSVEVHDARVLLTGTVRKPETAMEAVRIAWTVPGVREVMNELEVTAAGDPAQYARDTWIAAQVRSRLLFGKYIRSTNYNVEAVNGSVYLLGLAQSEDELSRALNVVRQTQGVHRVVSYVRMRDSELRDRDEAHGEEGYSSGQSGDSSY